MARPARVSPYLCLASATSVGLVVGGISFAVPRHGQPFALLAGLMAVAVGVGVIAYSTYRWQRARKYDGNH